MNIESEESEAEFDYQDILERNSDEVNKYTYNSFFRTLMRNQNPEYRWKSSFKH